MKADKIKIAETYSIIMRHCKLERRAKGRIQVKELATQLEITPGYMSALENGRVLPSIELFLKYLILSGFDLNPLFQLTITDSKQDSEISKLRNDLFRQLNAMDEDQLHFLIEQAKVAKILKIKRK